MAEDTYDPGFQNWLKNEAVWAPIPQLTPEQEVQFQDWIKGTTWFKEFEHNYGGPPNLNDPGYNYRGAWRGGLVPGLNTEDMTFHWPSSLPNGDLLKGREHPTLIMEYQARQKAKSK